MLPQDQLGQMISYNGTRKIVRLYGSMIPTLLEVNLDMGIYLSQFRSQLTISHLTIAETIREERRQAEKRLIPFRISSYFSQESRNRSIKSVLLFTYFLTP